jgi:hypothetical protein
MLKTKMTMEPIHAEVAPVQTYAAWISQLKSGVWRVVTVPGGSRAYEMGYRYVAIQEEEVPHYLENGSTLVGAP